MGAPSSAWFQVRALAVEGSGPADPIRTGRRCAAPDLDFVLFEADDCSGGPPRGRSDAHEHTPEHSASRGGERRCRRQVKRSNPPMSASPVPDDRDEPISRRPSHISLSAALNSVVGIAKAVVIGVFLLSHGSIYATAFLALGAFYLIWLIGALTDRAALVRSAFFLIALFYIAWGIVAVIQGYDDYGLAVGAYGIWALFSFASMYGGAYSKRTATWMIVGHGLALAGLLFVDVGWQADTGFILAAVIAAVAQGISAKFDR